jgi:hypothetical protein
MGDHRNNPRALLARAVPAAPVGKIEKIALVGSRVPKQHLLLVPQNEVREGPSEDGQRTLEIFARHASVVDGELVVPAEPTWGPLTLQPGQRLVRLGLDPLTDEDFDFIVTLMHQQADATITDGDGNVRGTQVPIAELIRVGVTDLQAMHQQVRQGQLPQKPLVTSS